MLQDVIISNTLVTDWSCVGAVICAVPGSTRQTRTLRAGDESDCLEGGTRIFGSTLQQCSRTEAEL